MEHPIQRLTRENVNSFSSSSSSHCRCTSSSISNTSKVFRRINRIITFRIKIRTNSPTAIQQGIRKNSWRTTVAERTCLATNMTTLVISRCIRAMARATELFQTFILKRTIHHHSKTLEIMRNSQVDTIREMSIQDTNRWARVVYRETSTDQIIVQKYSHRRKYNTWRKSLFRSCKR